MPGEPNRSIHKGVFQREGERGVRRSAHTLSRCIPRAAKILMIFNIDSNLIFSASLELRRPPGTSSGLDHLYEGDIMAGGG